MYGTQWMNLMLMQWPDFLDITSETLLLENGFQKDCWYSACVYNKTMTQKN